IDEAKRLAQQALTEDPNYANTYATMALICLANDEFDEAQHFFEQAEKHSYDSLALRLNRANLYVRRPDLGSAADVLMPILKLEFESELKATISPYSPEVREGLVAPLIDITCDYFEQLHVAGEELKAKPKPTNNKAKRPNQKKTLEQRIQKKQQRDQIAQFKFYLRIILKTSEEVANEELLFFLEELLNLKFIKEDANLKAQIEQRITQILNLIKQKQEQEAKAKLEAERLAKEEIAQNQILDKVEWLKNHHFSREMLEIYLLMNKGRSTEGIIKSLLNLNAPQLLMELITGYFKLETKINFARSVPAKLAVYLHKNESLQWQDAEVFIKGIANKLKPKEITPEAIDALTQAIDSGQTVTQVVQNLEVIILKAMEEKDKKAQSGANRANSPIIVGILVLLLTQQLHDVVSYLVLAGLMIFGLALNSTRNRGGISEDGESQLKQILSRLGYPQDSISILVREFKQLFREINFARLQQRSREISQSQDIEELESFLAEVIFLNRQEGSPASDTSFRIIGLLASSLNTREDIFEAIEQSELSDDEKSELKWLLTVCASQGQLGHILFSLLGYNLKGAYVRYDDRDGHAFSFIVLEDERILFEDYSLFKGGEIDIVTYYQKEGECYYLKPEYRIDPQRAQLWRRQFMSGELTQELNLKEFLNTFYPNFNIFEDYGLTSAILSNLGYINVGLGQGAEAIQKLRAAILREPKFALAHRILGSSLLLESRLDDARVELEVAARLDPNDFKTHYELGLVEEMRSSVTRVADNPSEDSGSAPVSQSPVIVGIVVLLLTHQLGEIISYLVFAGIVILVGYFALREILKATGILLKQYPSRAGPIIISNIKNQKSKIDFGLGLSKVEGLLRQKTKFYFFIRYLLRSTMIRDFSISAGSIFLSSRIRTLWTSFIAWGVSNRGLKMIIPVCEPRGYKVRLPKSKSLVIITAFSFLAISMTVPLVTEILPNSCKVIIENPFSLSNFAVLPNTHSSISNFILAGLYFLKEMYLFIFNQLIGIGNAGIDIFQGYLGKVIFVDNLFELNASGEQIQYLPHHYTMPFYAGLAMAYIWIYRNTLKQIFHNFTSKIKNIITSYQSQIDFGLLRNLLNGFGLPSVAGGDLIAATALLILVVSLLLAQSPLAFAFLLFGLAQSSGGKRPNQDAMRLRIDDKEFETVVNNFVRRIRGEDSEGERSEFGRENLGQLFRLIQRFPGNIKQFMNFMNFVSWVNDSPQERADNLRSIRLLPVLREAKESHNRAVRLCVERSYAKALEILLDFAVANLSINVPISVYSMVTVPVFRQAIFLSKNQIVKTRIRNWEHKTRLLFKLAWKEVSEKQKLRLIKLSGEHFDYLLPNSQDFVDPRNPRTPLLWLVHQKAIALLKKGTRNLGKEHPDLIARLDSFQLLKTVLCGGRIKVEGCDVEPVWGLFDTRVELIKGILEESKLEPTRRAKWQAWEEQAKEALKMSTLALWLSDEPELIIEQENERQEDARNYIVKLHNKIRTSFDPARFFKKVKTKGLGLNLQELTYSELLAALFLNPDDQPFLLDIHSIPFGGRHFARMVYIRPVDFPDYYNLVLNFAERQEGRFVQEKRFGKVLVSSYAFNISRRQYRELDSRIQSFKHTVNRLLDTSREQSRMEVAGLGRTKRLPVLEIKQLLKNGEIIIDSQARLRFVSNTGIENLRRSQWQDGEFISEHWRWIHGREGLQIYSQIYLETIGIKDTQTGKFIRRIVQPKYSLLLNALAFLSRGRRLVSFSSAVVRGYIISQGFDIDLSEVNSILKQIQKNNSFPGLRFERSEWVIQKGTRPNPPSRGQNLNSFLPLLFINDVTSSIMANLDLTIGWIVFGILAAILAWLVYKRADTWLKKLSRFYLIVTLLLTLLPTILNGQLQNPAPIKSLPESQQEISDTTFVQDKQKIADFLKVFTAAINSRESIKSDYAPQSVAMAYQISQDLADSIAKFFQISREIKLFIEDEEKFRQEYQEKHIANIMERSRHPEMTSSKPLLVLDNVYHGRLNSLQTRANLLIWQSVVLLDELEGYFMEQDFAVLFWRDKTAHLGLKGVAGVNAITMVGRRDNDEGVFIGQEIGTSYYSIGGVTFGIINKEGKLVIYVGYLPEDIKSELQNDLNRESRLIIIRSILGENNSRYALPLSESIHQLLKKEFSSISNVDTVVAGILYKGEDRVVFHEYSHRDFYKALDAQNDEIIAILSEFEKTPYFALAKILINIILGPNGIVDLREVNSEVLSNLVQEAKQRNLIAESVPSSIKRRFTVIKKTWRAISGSRKDALSDINLDNLKRMIEALSKLEPEQLQEIADTIKQKYLKDVDSQEGSELNSTSQVFSLMASLVAFVSGFMVLGLAIASEENAREGKSKRGRPNSDTRILSAIEHLKSQGRKAITQRMIAREAGVVPSTISNRKKANPAVKSALESLPRAKKGPPSSDQKILSAIKRLKSQGRKAITQTMIAQEAGVNPMTVSNRKKANPEIKTAIDRLPKLRKERPSGNADSLILTAIERLQSQGHSAITQTMLAQEAGVVPETISRRKKANPQIKQAIEKLLKIGLPSILLLALSLVSMFFWGFSLSIPTLVMGLAKEQGSKPDSIAEYISQKRILAPPEIRAILAVEVLKSKGYKWGSPKMIAAQAGFSNTSGLSHIKRKCPEVKKAIDSFSRVAYLKRVIKKYRLNEYPKRSRVVMLARKAKITESTVRFRLRKNSELRIALFESAEFPFMPRRKHKLLPLLAQWIINLINELIDEAHLYGYEVLLPQEELARLMGVRRDTIYAQAKRPKVRKALNRVSTEGYLVAMARRLKGKIRKAMTAPEFIQKVNISTSTVRYNLKKSILLQRIFLGMLVLILCPSVFYSALFLVIGLTINSAQERKDAILKAVTEAANPNLSLEEFNPLQRKNLSQGNQRIVDKLSKQKVLLIAMFGRLITKEHLQGLLKKRYVFIVIDQNGAEQYICVNDLDKYYSQTKVRFYRFWSEPTEIGVYERYIHPEYAKGLEKSEDEAQKIVRIYGPGSTGQGIRKLFAKASIILKLLADGTIVRGLTKEGKEIYILAKFIDKQKSKDNIRRWLLTQLPIEGSSELVNLAFNLALNYHAETKLDYRDEHYIDDATEYLYTLAEVVGGTLTPDLAVIALLKGIPENEMGAFVGGNNARTALLVHEICSIPVTADSVSFDKHYVDKFKRMVVDMAQGNPDVLLLVMAYKLHFLKTIPQEQKPDYKDEMEDVWAALAEDLQLKSLAAEFKDLAAQTDEDLYKGVVSNVVERYSLTFEELRKKAQEIKGTIQAKLTEPNNGLTEVRIEEDVKSVASLIRKIRYNLAGDISRFVEIKDILRFRVVTPTIEQAYLAMAMVIDVVVKEKDFAEIDEPKDVSMRPKETGYRSLHLYFRGKPEWNPNLYFEVQVLTEYFYLLAEFGPFMHSLYEAKLKGLGYRKITEIAQMEGSLSDKLSEYQRARRAEQEIYVRYQAAREQPEQILTLPKEAIVADVLAFWRVDLLGEVSWVKLSLAHQPHVSITVRLKYSLRSGELITPIHKNQSHPKNRAQKEQTDSLLDLFSKVKTLRAKLVLLCRGFGQQDKDEAISSGIEQLKKVGIDWQTGNSQKVLRLLSLVMIGLHLKYENTDNEVEKLNELFAAVGYGLISPKKVFDLYEAMDKGTRGKIQPQKGSATILGIISSFILSIIVAVVLSNFGCANTKLLNPNNQNQTIEELSRAQKQKLFDEYILDGAIQILLKNYHEPLWDKTTRFIDHYGAVIYLDSRVSLDHPHSPLSQFLWELRLASKTFSSSSQAKQVDSYEAKIVKVAGEIFEAQTESELIDRRFATDSNYVLTPKQMQDSLRLFENIKIAQAKQREIAKQIIHLIEQYKTEQTGTRLNSLPFPLIGQLLSFLLISGLPLAIPLGICLNSPHQLILSALKSLEEKTDALHLKLQRFIPEPYSARDILILQALNILEIQYFLESLPDERFQRAVAQHLTKRFQKFNFEAIWQDAKQISLSTKLQVVIWHIVEYFANTHSLSPSDLEKLYQNLPLKTLIRLWQETHAQKGKGIVSFIIWPILFVLGLGFLSLSLISGSEGFTPTFVIPLTMFLGIAVDRGKTKNWPKRMMLRAYPIVIDGKEKDFLDVILEPGRSREEILQMLQTRKRRHIKAGEAQKEFYSIKESGQILDLYYADLLNHMRDKNFIDWLVNSQGLKPEYRPKHAGKRQQWFIHRELLNLLFELEEDLVPIALIKQRMHRAFGANPNHLHYSLFDVTTLLGQARTRAVFGRRNIVVRSRFYGTRIKFGYMISLYNLILLVLELRRNQRILKNWKDVKTVYQKAKGKKANYATCHEFVDSLGLTVKRVVRFTGGNSPLCVAPFSQLEAKELVEAQTDSEVGLIPCKIWTRNGWNIGYDSWDIEKLLEVYAKTNWTNRTAWQARRLIRGQLRWRNRFGLNKKLMAKLQEILESEKSATSVPTQVVYILEILSEIAQPQTIGELSKLAKGKSRAIQSAIAYTERKIRCRLEIERAIPFHEVAWEARVSKPNSAINEHSRARFIQRLEEQIFETEPLLFRLAEQVSLAQGASIEVNIFRSIHIIKNKEDLYYLSVPVRRNLRPERLFVEYNLASDQFSFSVSNVIYHDEFAQLTARESKRLDRYGGLYIGGRFWARFNIPNAQVQVDVHEGVVTQVHFVKENITRPMNLIFDCKTGKLIDAFLALPQKRFSQLDGVWIKEQLNNLGQLRLRKGGEILCSFPQLPNHWVGYTVVKGELQDIEPLDVELSQLDARRDLLQTVHQQKGNRQTAYDRLFYFWAQHYPDILQFQLDDFKEPILLTKRKLGKYRANCQARVRKFLDTPEGKALLQILEEKSKKQQDDLNKVLEASGLKPEQEIASRLGLVDVDDEEIQRIIANLLLKQKEMPKEQFQEWLISEFGLEFEREAEVIEELLIKAQEEKDFSTDEEEIAEILEIKPEDVEIEVIIIHDKKDEGLKENKIIQQLTTMYGISQQKAQRLWELAQKVYQEKGGADLSAELSEDEEQEETYEDEESFLRGLFALLPFGGFDVSPILVNLIFALFILLVVVGQDKGDKNQILADIGKTNDVDKLGEKLKKHIKDKDVVSAIIKQFTRIYLRELPTTREKREHEKQQRQIRDLLKDIFAHSRFILDYLQAGIKTEAQEREEDFKATQSSFKIKRAPSHYKGQERGKYEHIKLIPRFSGSMGDSVAEALNKKELKGLFELIGPKYGYASIDYRGMVGILQLKLVSLTRSCLKHYGDRNDAKSLRFINTYLSRLKALEKFYQGESDEYAKKGLRTVRRIITIVEKHIPKQSSGQKGIIHIGVFFIIFALAGLFIWILAASPAHLLGIFVLGASLSQTLEINEQDLTKYLTKAEIRIVDEIICTYAGTYRYVVIDFLRGFLLDNQIQTALSPGGIWHSERAKIFSILENIFVRANHYECKANKALIAILNDERVILARKSNSIPRDLIRETIDECLSKERRKTLNASLKDKIGPWARFPTDYMQAYFTLGILIALYPSILEEVLD
ncbi:MAG: hypothetical protein Q8O13_03595, partial [Candidatus Omnitrophota bacterium]|nr:hypothetical protein [Candidatus Omnitrophota bacterium]